MSSPAHPIRKVLIANRGEIAIRIIRACRDMGAATVAVFSEADRTALHVRLADEALALGPPPANESYLNIERILAAASKSGADTIHPGYGFLAENADFAQACIDTGLLWVGPRPGVMRQMGNKTAARRLLESMGLPVVPGTATPLDSVAQAKEVSQRIGYPVMLKAAAGGGGKGMRIVTAPEEMPSAFETARSEARNAFGDDSVYVEKYVVQPRHVEIQVLGDRHGNIVYLGERDCSVQRRHQKVIEETPSPALDDTTRRRMGETAVAAARQAGYDNAGTIEFLVDAQRRFYFLEMNTRLQVEHPVTEMVTGLDLVRLQFQVASGIPLEFRQEDIRPRGAAIECRVYAEDPEQNFFPCPGRIHQLAEPSGPGVRVDSGVYAGYEVPLYYDPLLAKLITWGEDRQQAVKRMRRALREYSLAGVRSTLPLFQAIFEEPDFLRGQYDTGYLNSRLSKLLIHGLENQADPRILATALAHHLAEQRRRAPAGMTQVTSPWREAAKRDGLRRR